MRRCLINILSNFKTLFQDARKIVSLDSPANTTQFVPDSELFDYSELVAIQVVALKLMEWVTALSFEQDIYLPTELSQAYW